MIESAGSNFRSTLKHHSEVIVGDENSRAFRPHIRLKKWGDESWLGLGLETTVNLQHQFDGDKIRWMDHQTQMEAVFYEHTASDAEHGAFEFEIILYKRPTSSVLPLTCDFSGLDLFYQPPLSSEEVARGNIRPENVVGSYAAYHSSKSPLHGIPGHADKYRTCKAFHLYRPEAIDASGNRRWLDFIYDPERKTMSILLNPAWFHSATYPVTIDPTVGYTSLGASDNNDGAFLIATNYAAASAGDANPGTAYFGGHAGSATPVTVMMAAYADGSANPNGVAKVSGNAAITVQLTAAFYSAAITWTGITAANYWLSWNGVSGPNSHSMYDTGSTAYYRARTHSNDMPDPWGTNGGSYAAKTSLYVDYTASGGGGRTTKNTRTPSLHMSDLGIGRRIYK